MRQLATGQPVAIAAMHDRLAGTRVADVGALWQSTPRTALPAEEQGANTNNSVAKITNALSQKGSLWGLSYETAIASKWIALNETRTAKIMSPEEIKDWPTTNKQIADSLFIGAPFEQPQPLNQLNNRYFRFAKNRNYESRKIQEYYFLPQYYCSLFDADVLVFC